MTSSEITALEHMLSKILSIDHDTWNGGALYLLGKPELRAFFMSLKKMEEQYVSLVSIHPSVFLSGSCVILLLGAQRFSYSEQ